MKTSLPEHLPKPDEHGTYWLSFRRASGAAIFPSYLMRGKFHACDTNVEPLVVSSNGDGRGAGLRYFDSPNEALEFLKARGT